MKHTSRVMLSLQLLFVMAVSTEHYVQAKIPTTYRGRLRTTITNNYSLPTSYDIAITSTMIASSCYTISTPGVYVLKDSINYTGTDAVFFITAEHVELNMQGFFIRYSGSSNNTVHGITISPGLKNVCIKDGVVSGFTGYGIYANGSTSNPIDHVSLEQLSVTHNALGGLYLSGVHNSSVYNCTMHKNGTNGTSRGIEIVDSTNIKLDAVSSSNNSATEGNSCYGFKIHDSSAITCTRCSANANQGTYAYGFCLTGTSFACTFNECCATHNISTSSHADVSGFCVSNNNNVLTSCVAQTNIATATSIGFYLNEAHYTYCTDCISYCQQSTGSNSAASYGFYSANGTGNTLLRCTAIGNRASTVNTSTGAGFALYGSAGTDGEQYSVIQECKAQFNNGGAGLGYGILIEKGEYCTLQHNNITGNIGSRGGYGIRDIASMSTNFASNNFAFANQDTISNTTQNYALAPRGNADMFSVSRGYTDDLSAAEPKHSFDNVEIVVSGR